MLYRHWKQALVNSMTTSQPNTVLNLTIYVITTVSFSALLTHIPLLNESRNLTFRKRASSI